MEPMGVISGPEVGSGSASPARSGATTPDLNSHVPHDSVFEPTLPLDDF